MKETHKNACCEKWLKFIACGSLSCPDCGELIVVEEENNDNPE